MDAKEKARRQVEEVFKTAPKSFFELLDNMAKTDRHKDDCAFSLSNWDTNVQCNCGYYS